MIIKRSRSLWWKSHWYIDKDAKETKTEQLPELFYNSSAAESLLVETYSFAISCPFGAEDGGHASKQKADVYAKRASELQKILDSRHYPAPDDAFVFYKKRGSIDDPFFYSRLAGDNLHTGGVVDQLSLVRETVGYTPVFLHASLR